MVVMQDVENNLYYGLLLNVPDGPNRRVTQLTSWLVFFGGTNLY
jgi:hypothetical protein